MAKWLPEVRVPKAVSIINELVQIGQLLLAVVAMLTPLLGIGYLYILGYGPVAIASLLSALSVLGIMVVFRVWRHKRTNRESDWNPYIWVKSRRSTARVESATEIRYTHQLHIEILRNRENQFAFRVGWTGVGNLAVSVKNPGFRCELNPAPAEMANVLIVHFDRPRRKRDTIDLEFTIMTSGTSRIQQPFYSLTHYESRLPREAVIRVEFADGLKVNSAQKEIYASDAAAWPLHPPESVEIDGNRFVEWPVPRKAGQRYAIRWELD